MNNRNNFNACFYHLSHHGDWIILDGVWFVEDGVLATIGDLFDAVCDVCVEARECYTALLEKISSAAAYAFDKGFGEGAVAPI